MGKRYNYAKIFVTKKDVEEQLKLACPNLQHKSGIYFYMYFSSDIVATRNRYKS